MDLGVYSDARDYLLYVTSAPKLYMPREERTVPMPIYIQNCPCNASYTMLIHLTSSKSLTLHSYHIHDVLALKSFLPARVNAAQRAAMQYNTPPPRPKSLSLRSISSGRIMCRLGHHLFALTHGLAVIPLNLLFRRLCTVCITTRSGLRGRGVCGR